MPIPGGALYSPSVLSLKCLDAVKIHSRNLSPTSSGDLRFANGRRELIARSRFASSLIVFFAHSNVVLNSHIIEFFVELAESELVDRAAARALEVCKGSLSKLEMVCLDMKFVVLVENMLGQHGV